jgi:hypothetical protein
MASDASPDFRKASISSTIVELADIVNSQDGNIGKLTYQNTLFPEPATEVKNYQFLKRSDCWVKLTFTVDPQNGIRPR